MSSENNSLTVESELYSENRLNIHETLNNANRLTKLIVSCEQSILKPGDPVPSDEDGDLVLPRGRRFEIAIEYSPCTTIPLVGLQLWRGALVLGDFVLHYGRTIFADKIILELGTGVGLTSVTAGIFAKEVIATDVPEEDVIELLKRNFDRNSSIIKSNVIIEPLDFFKDWSLEMARKISNVDIVLAADVIYDNVLTEAFVKTLTKILMCGGKRVVYIALEKRYVFTIADLDTVAPCYDYFVEFLKKSWSSAPMSSWSLRQIDIDFPQYFDYERNRHIVLWEIRNR